MNLRSYGWLALVVLILGLVVLYQGWNHGPLQIGGQCGTTTQSSSPGAAGTGNGMNSMGGNTQK